MWYLSFSDWLILLGLILSRSTHAVSGYERLLFYFTVEREAYGSGPFQFHQMLRDFKGLPTSHSICQETSFRPENLLWDCSRASGDLDNHGTPLSHRVLPLPDASPRGSLHQVPAPAVHLWVAVSTSRTFLESYIQWCPFLSCIIKVKR